MLRKAQRTRQWTVRPPVGETQVGKCRWLDGAYEDPIEEKLGDEAIAPARLRPLRGEDSPSW